MLKFLFSVYLILVSALLSAEDKTTYQFLSGDFAPYTSSTMANGGIATTIVQRVMSAIGKNVEITYLPWRRGHILALQGDYFAIYPYSENDERKEKWRYSAPLYELDELFFVKDGQTFDYKSREDLHNRSICRPKGYNLFGLEKLREKGLLKIEQPPNLKACFLMLDIGRVDTVLTNPNTGWSIVKDLSLDPKAFKTLSKPYRSHSHHLIVSKVVPDGRTFLDEFNKKLQYLKQTGEINELLNQVDSQ